MKRNSIIPLLLAYILISSFFFSCEQDLLESPSFKSRGSYSTGSVEAPTNVSASQGGYRSITLSWVAAKNANQYYIYSSDTETGSFQKIAETSDSTCNITLGEVPDILKYYKICTVDYDGVVSPFSATCFGSTMATPIVTSVVQSANGNAITVKWYKGVNCSEKTYLTSDLIYTLVLYASDGKSVVNEVSLIATDDSVINSASYSFYNLQANTEYYVQIKSHLKSSQGSAEISDIVNKSTAHSLIPAAPGNLSIEKGVSSSYVKLSWKLPKFAEVKSGDTYASRPVYFRIYRKEYSQPDISYSLLVSYFGTNPTNKNVPIAGSDSIITFSCVGDGFGTSSSANVTVISSTDESAETNQNYLDYTSTSIITFNDTSVEKGKRYSYRIQSFIDDNGTKLTTSDESFAEGSGWLISSSVFTISSTLVYDETDENKINSVNIEANLKFENFGESYLYIITETVQEMDEKDAEVGTKQIHKHSGTSYDSFFPWHNSYETLPGEHYQYYNFSVSICSADGNETYATADAPGTVILINNKSKIPDVTSFSVKDGYKDKFILTWDYNDTCAYSILWTNKDKNGVVVDNCSLDLLKEDLHISGNTATYEHIAESGDTRFLYTLTANNGFQSNKTLGDEYFTLGTPVIEFNGGDYDSLTVYWKSIKKASSYEISAAYKGESELFPNDVVSTPVESNGVYSCTITRPKDYDKASVNGKPIDFKVEASSDTGDKTQSNLLVSTLGPANTNLVVKGSNKAITLNWNEVAGAKGYLIFRVKYSKNYIDTNNKGDVYYYNVENEKLSLINDSESPNASCSKTAGVFTFIDKYQVAKDYKNQYQTDQAQLSWGLPYGYTVLPVKKDSDYSFSDLLEISASSDAIAYADISDCELKCATSGYGLNIIASKASTNNNVQISWTPPYEASGKPVIFYRPYNASNGSEWTKYDVSNKDSSAECPPYVSYKAYDYFVCYNPESVFVVDPYYETFLSENENNGEKNNKGYIFSFEPLSAKYAGTLNGSTYEKDENYYSERVSWNLWDYNERALGPDSWCIELYNSDKSDNWIKLADILPGKENESKVGQIMSDSDKNLYDISIDASNSYTLQIYPTSVTSDTDSTDGLLKVLKNLKHYYRIAGSRTENDGGNTKTITAEFGSDFGVYAYRQISLKEFAFVTATALSYSLYNSTYSSVAEKGTWSTNRLFTFKTPGPYIHNISGELWAGTNGTGQKPIVYGAKKDWGAMGSESSTPCTITFTAKDESDYKINYSGTVIIDSMKNGSGKYTINYNGSSLDARDSVSNLFIYK